MSADKRETVVFDMWVDEIRPGPVKEDEAMLILAFESSGTRGWDEDLVDHLHCVVRLPDGLVRTDGGGAINLPLCSCHQTHICCEIAKSDSIVEVPCWITVSLIRCAEEGNYLIGDLTLRLDNRLPRAWTRKTSLYRRTLRSLFL